MSTITVELECDGASIEKLSKELLSLRPVISQFPDDLVEKFFLAIGSDLKIGRGPAPRANNCIGVSVAFGDRTLELISALRAGELDPASCVTAFCHNLSPAAK